LIFSHTYPFIYPHLPQTKHFRRHPFLFSLLLCPVPFEGGRGDEPSPGFGVEVNLVQTLKVVRLKLSEENILSLFRVFVVFPKEIFEAASVFIDVLAGEGNLE
jgi:hypothetical protein